MDNRQEGNCLDTLKLLCEISELLKQKGGAHNMISHFFSVLLQYLREKRVTT